MLPVQQKRYTINSSIAHSISSSNYFEQPSPRESNIPKRPNLNQPLNRSSYVEMPERIQQAAFNQNYQESQNPARTIVIQDPVQKKQLLKKYKYINQLARMEYEDKEQEVYSRYTRQSKATVLKKIKARNQIAEFEEDDENQNQWFDELLEFKYGKESNGGNFHFQRQQ